MSSDRVTRSQAASGNPADAPSVADDTANLNSKDVLIRTLTRLFDDKFAAMKAELKSEWKSGLDDMKTEFRGRLDSLESRSRGPSLPVTQSSPFPRADALEKDEVPAVLAPKPSTFEPEATEAIFNLPELPTAIAEATETTPSLPMSTRTATVQFNHPPALQLSATIASTITLPDLSLRLFLSFSFFSKRAYAYLFSCKHQLQFRDLLSQQQMCCPKQKAWITSAID
ncbi:hypothetical protein SEPCBS57363_002843 [Sporothrix epigloea]|uniref:Uncharacterized protein n=1 Tax=Sporothrix epigloea TaxID=1892477 RepID=A0ABP0DLN8_9PEZI